MGKYKNHLSFLQSEGKVQEVVTNDTGPITNERSIEQELEENIPHSPSKEEASSFVASVEEINPAAKKEDNHIIVIDDSQSGKSEWPTSWIPSLNMTQSDKAILKSYNLNAWLSDSIINATQLLLKREMHWLEVYKMSTLGSQIPLKWEQGNLCK